MGRFEQYQLPNGPLRTASFLAARGSRVAYTNPTPDPIIGLFNTNTQKSTEYILPHTAGIFQFLPYGIVWKSRRIYVSCPEGPLAEFNPRNGKAVYYEGKFKNPRLASHKIALDSVGQIWIACHYRINLQTYAPGIARVRIRNNRAWLRYWVLPIEFSQPFDFWIDDKDRVWFSISGGGSLPSTHYSIGRLDPRASELRGWKVMDGRNPTFLGLSSLPGSDEIWFTRQSPAELYRLDLNTGRCDMFSHPAVSNLKDVIVDANGNPWFTSADGYINTVSRNQLGALVNIKESILPIDGYLGRITRTPVTAEKQPLWTTPVTSKLEPAQTVGPFIRWAPSGIGNSSPLGLLQHNDEFWFADSNRNQIGRLKA